MYIGELPNLYYDEEKKKYFPILANHLAPEGSKYSRDNVKREREQTRKRKRTAALSEKRAAQTVRRSAILQSSTVAGIGLSREHGLRSTACNLEARATAMAKQLQASDLLTLRSCESCGRRDTIFDFAVDPEADAIVWGVGSQNFSRLQYLAEYGKACAKYRKPLKLTTHSSQELDVVGFRSDMSSVSVTNGRTVVATAAAALRPGNVYVARLSEPGDHWGPTLDIPAPKHLLIGEPETTLWASAPNPPGGKDLVAIGGSNATFILGPEGDLLHTYHVTRDIRALDWLTPNVAVGGTRTRSILLWDARAGGHAVRFHHSSGITGIRALGNDSQIVACGLDGMAVYDVRMVQPGRPGSGSREWRKVPSASLLRLPFESERPSTPMDVWPRAGIVAAASDHNVIQLYSLRTGKQLGGLGKPNYAPDRERISRLRFVDDAGGRPTLMVAQGANLSEWSWGGAAGDGDVE